MENSASGTDGCDGAGGSAGEAGAEVALKPRRAPAAAMLPMSLRRVGARGSCRSGVFAGAIVQSLL